MVYTLEQWVSEFCWANNATWRPFSVSLLCYFLDWHSEVYPQCERCPVYLRTLGRGSILSGLEVYLSMWMDSLGPAVKTSATLSVLSRPNVMECDRLSLQTEVATAHGIVLLWTKFEDICTCPFLSSPNRDISAVSALAPNPGYVSQINLQTQFISHTKKDAIISFLSLLRSFFLSRFCAMIKKTAPLRCPCY